MIQKPPIENDALRSFTIKIEYFLYSHIAYSLCSTSVNLILQIHSVWTRKGLDLNHINLYKSSWIHSILGPENVSSLSYVSFLLASFFHVAFSLTIRCAGLPG